MCKNINKRINGRMHARPGFLIYIFLFILIASMLFAGCSADLLYFPGSRQESAEQDPDETVAKQENTAESTEKNIKEPSLNSQGNTNDAGSNPQEKPTVIVDDSEIQNNDSQIEKSTESKQEGDNLQINLQPPTIRLEIAEGPLYAQDNNICYYRIKAFITGEPYPDIVFNRDDSNGAWGGNTVQVNLIKDEAFTLICDVSNSQGSASSSIDIAWKDYSGQENDQQSQVSSQNDYDNPDNYLIDVNLTLQRVDVYYLEKLIKSMPCSGGRPETPTPVGTFNTNQKIYYAYVPKFGQGAYYWTRFYGAYLFHSVPYDANRNLLTEELAKIGTPASHGCIRLYLEDAKWMYETLPLGIEVNIHV